VFTVSSIYKKLEAFSAQEEVTGEDDRMVFVQLWKSPAPSKVVAFSWRALLNRIPTRSNLIRRNAIPTSVNSHCVFCNMVEESTNHLFLHCLETWKIWLQIQKWLEVCLITPSNLFSHWECWNGLVSYHKEHQRGMRLIWLSTVWAIWKARNNIIFNNSVFSLDDMVEEIQVLSWR